MQSYHIEKLDENRTLFTQVHVFDLGGLGSNQTLQKMVVKDRGLQLRTNLIKHMNTKPKDFSLKSMEDQLKKDPLGRLILDLNIEKLQKEYDEKMLDLEKKKKEVMTLILMKKRKIKKTLKRKKRK